MAKAHSHKKSSKAVQHDDGSVPLLHRLIEHFWVLSPAFTRWAESHMHTNKLTPQRVRLLLQLYENGAMKMSELRNALGVSATNITALVDVLEKDRMVERHPHSSDRRATLISITEKAERQLDENCGQFKNRVAELFSGFTERDQEELLRLLAHMKEALIERGVLENSPDCCKASAKEK